jgi:hypothetical protein
MAQGHKTNTVDLREKLTGRSRSNQWVYWVIGGLIAVALIVPLALAVPSFMPTRQPSYGSVPSEAELQSVGTGAGTLPPVSKDDRQAMIDGAKSSGAPIADDTKVSVRFDKDTSHAILSVPTGGGKTFRVKTYRIAAQPDGSWALQ